MSDELKILILNDSESDIKHIKNEIKTHFKNVVIEFAQNRKNFIIKLSRFKPNIVLSDSYLTDFDGLTALNITHEMFPDLPFIIVTGSQGEEFAILCIKRGAYDYILKNHLKKIPVAIEEALKKYELILENKKVYEELRESEKKFRLLAENALDIIYRYEFFPKRGFTYVSPSATKITGYSPEEHYSDPDLAFKIVHPDDRHLWEKIARGEIKIDEPVTLRWIRKDGRIIWTEQKNVPIYNDKGDLIAIEGIARDITRNKELEENLRESENRFRLISSLITDYAYSFKVDDKLNLIGEWVSDSFTRVFGWTVLELEALGGWRKAFYEDDLTKVIKHVEKVLAGNPDKIECRMVTKFGDVRWIKNYAVPIFNNGSKKIVKIFGVAEDITEKKKLELEIQERKDQFEKLADQTTTAIFIYQGENFVYVNKATEKITGYTKDELLKMKFYDVVHPEFKELIKERGLKRQRGDPVPQNYEFKIITKDGNEKWIDFSGGLINWFGNPAGLGTAYDITQLKIAIENLEKLNKQFSDLIENAPIGIIIEDENGNILSFNKMYEKITGYSKNELIGKNVKVFASPKNISLVDTHIKKILDGESLDHIVESYKKDGSRIFVHLIETSFTLPEGKKGIISFCEDLTEKVLLQNQLVENVKRFRTIFETAEEGICIVDQNDIIMDVNKKFCDIIGYNKDEILNQNFDEKFVHPDERENALREKEKIVKGEASIFERRLIKKDRKIIWVKIAATGIFDEKGNFIGSFAFITDITEQKKLQEKLRKSEEQFRLIWENSHDGMRLTDEKGKVILVNPAFCKMIGLKKEEIEGKNLSEIYSVERREYIQQKHQERFKSGRIKTNFETEVVLHDGRKLWFEVSNSFIKIGDDKYLLGIFRDITERKRLQEELIRSEKQFRMIWEKSNDSMILLDSKGFIRLINPAMCNLVGLEENELINQSISVIFSEETKKEMLDIHLKKFSKGDFKEKFEGAAKLHNGREIYFEASFAIIQLGGEKFYLAIIRDITERKKLIDELIRAKEEAEEANRLKSGFISMMSHEIRTPLNVILGFTNVLKDYFFYGEGDREDLPKFFDAIENSGKRLLNTINQILDISRIEANEFEIHPKPIDLNKKVLDAINQIQILANKKNLSFNVNLDKEIGELMLDEYCIDGILFNLINNAVKFSFENSKIDVTTLLRRDDVLFKIRDYGIGMSEEYQKHLFQPFSQEEVGYSRPYEGTGLGLALTKRFVELLNGKIRVWSKKNEGTLFEVILPVKIKEI